jgi:hypothetical protein
MRSFGNLAGLLVVALIAVFLYKLYLAPQNTGASHAASPTQTIDSIGAQNDLLAIGQAERAYQVEHGKYASLDELTSSGSVRFKKDREGYAYEVEASDDSFHATARCVAQSPGCQSYVIDQNMAVHPAQ